MLPVEAVLPQLKEALRTRTEAVLQAPPGAGKTTLVPLALRDESWLNGRRILMLEPRRLAARASAQRMAYLIGERVGETVGYRVRLDTRVSRRTQIEVVTEGILTRFIQEDPSLRDVGLVIFDEFHERSLQADLGLALTLESQAVLREDLRILVMSATLESERVSALLGDAPVVRSEGRSYPVETRYLSRRPPRRIESAAAPAVRRALAEAEGDVLVFLPGQAEIRRTEARLKERALPQRVRVLPLYGNLSGEEQDRAIAPSPEGQRKVVLATSIAETSLTIEGVRVVVDGGLMRVPRFDPSSGMTRLATVAVSKASADQRRGRAGRLAPGLCYRLWTRHMQQHLRPHRRPEIEEADLAPLALELARWGATDPSQLRWLDPPPRAAFDQARSLLQQLAALDEDGLITEEGRRMVGLGLHPRLAHMLLRADAMHHRRLACRLAALVEERDILRAKGGVQDVDVRLRLEVLRTGREPPAFAHGVSVNRRAVHHVRRMARHWERRLGGGGRDTSIEAAGLLLAFAYPDRIAELRSSDGGRFRLRNGRAAVLPAPQLLSDAPYLVAANIGGRRGESRIYLAAPVARDELEAHFSDQIEEEDLVEWDDRSERVIARRRTTLGAVVLRDDPLPDPDPAPLIEALLQGVSAKGMGVLPWTKKSRALQQRMTFLSRHAEGFPDASTDFLEQSLEQWLSPHLYGMRRLDELQKLDMTDILLGMLNWDQRRTLDAEAPTHLEVPSGSRIRIDYSNPGAPVLPVRLQEMFGATETPRLAGGRVPLTLHLLSPAQRPVQVTQDLASFWREAYFEVKKDMKGRYPKHYWPDDPLTAIPTRRTRPRR